MPNNDSVQAFLRVINAKLNNLRTSLNSFINAFSQDDKATKIEKAQELLDNIAVLKDSLDQKDWPQWIATLEGRISWYISKVDTQKDAGLLVFQTMTSIYPQIQNHTWNFDKEPINLAIDFSSLYQECYRFSKASVLFDELVEQLEKVVSSGEIDSKKATQTLEKLIATIKKNSRGDLFSAAMAWDFTRTYLKNFVYQILKETPVLKHAAEALEKTMEDLDVEFSDIHGELRNKLDNVTKTEFPMHNYNLLLPEGKVENSLESKRS